jgi:hypothetical protein
MPPLEDTLDYNIQSIVIVLVTCASKTPCSAPFLSRRDDSTPPYPEGPAPPGPPGPAPDPEHLLPGGRQGRGGLSTTDSQRRSECPFLSQRAPPSG